MEALIISKQDALKNLSKIIQQKEFCYFLSADYLSYVKIRNQLGDRYNIQTLGQEFHEAIKRIKNDYLSFCHRLNLANQSDIYWESHLASRNSASIPLLRNLTYFHCVKKILENCHNRIIFICESPALAKVIESELKKKGIHCSLKFRTHGLWYFIRSYLLLFFRGSRFLASNILQWCYSRLLKKKKIFNSTQGQRVVLRSWVTAGCFNASNQFRNRNFGSLADYLRERGSDVWILPTFFNLDKSIFAQLKQMIDCSDQFIIAHQYLSIGDIFRALIDGIKGMPLNLADTLFEGQDFSGVIKEVHFNSSLSPELLSFKSVKYLIKRMAQKNVRIDKFIYPMENNVPEKPFILAVRKEYPNSKIMGFQHTVWFKEQLGMFMHPSELSYHPMPDQIVCSGRRYLDILKEAGFPRERLILGPNLRYSLDIQNFKRSSSNGSFSKKVLVVLNFSLEQAAELLDKVKVALTGYDDVKVYIKPHPLIPIKNLQKYLLDIGFLRYEWAEGSVQEWVARVDAVIMTGGSVSNLEVIVLGVPLIRVSLGCDFDFDPLWDQSPWTLFVSSTDEIRQCLENAFQMDHAMREKLSEFGLKVAADYFEPITSKSLEVF